MSKPAAILRKNLEKLLERAQWSQAALARKLKVQPTVISRWLSGEVSPGLDAVDALARAFGLTATEILADETPEPRVAEPDPQTMLNRVSNYILELEQRIEVTRRVREEQDKLRDPRLDLIIATWPKMSEDERQDLMIFFESRAAHLESKASAKGSVRRGKREG